MLCVVLKICCYGRDMFDFILLWLKSFIFVKINVDCFECMCVCVGSLFGILLVGLISYVLLLYEVCIIWLIVFMGVFVVLLFVVLFSLLV